MTAPSSEPPGRVPSELGRYAGLGVQFAASVLLLTFGGYWLDEWLGTLPLFMVLGVLLGAVGGTVAIVKQVPPPSGGSGGRPDS